QPGPELYEKQVRPLFASRCVGCHGEKRRQAGLDLRSRAGMLQGGESGPALVPGSADRSLLYRLASRREMPPRKGGHLTDAELALVRRWIDAGAPVPAEASPGRATQGPLFWSFRKPVRPPVPGETIALAGVSPLAPNAGALANKIE